MKNIALIVIKTITGFQIVTKNNVMKNTKNIEIRDQELPNNRSYNTSVVNPAILKTTETKIKPDCSSRDNDRSRYNRKYYHNDRYRNTDRYRSNSRDLKVHTHPDLDMTTNIKEELHPDLHIDHHTETTLITDIILDQDIDLVLNHKEIPLDGLIIHIDLHPNQEITDHDLEHFHRIDNKIESIK